MRIHQQLIEFKKAFIILDEANKELQRYINSSKFLCGNELDRYVNISDIQSRLYNAEERLFQETSVFELIGENND